MNLLKIIFEYKLKFHRCLFKHRNLIEKANRITVYLLFATISLFAIFNSHCLMVISAIISICFLLTELARSLNQITTSLRTFLVDGIFTEFIIMVTLILLIHQIMPNESTIYTSIIQYILITLAITVSWSVVSCFANNKVAKLTNIILTTVVGLLIYIKDTIFDVLPDSLFQRYDSNDFFITLGYTPKSVAQATLDYLFLPLLISNIVATLVCEIKGYWIDKYNGGKDITMEMIKSNINEEKDYGVKFKNRLKEVDDMCNLSQGFYDDGKAEGIIEGEAKGLINAAKELGASYEKTLDMVADKLHISHEDSKKYMDMYWKAEE